MIFLIFRSKQHNLIKNFCLSFVSSVRNNFFNILSKLQYQAALSAFNLQEMLLTKTSLIWACCVQVIRHDIRKLQQKASEVQFIPKKPKQFENEELKN